MSPQRQPKRPQREHDNHCDYEPCHVTGSSYLAPVQPVVVLELVAVIPPERA